jgi:hypothetical protein
MGVTGILTMPYPLIPNPQSRIPSPESQIPTLSRLFSAAPEDVTTNRNGRGAVMSSTLRRTFAVFGVVLFFSFSAACQKSNPARPSFVPSSLTGPGAGVPLTLTGLSGSYVGMANELCEGGLPVAIDELKVDYKVSGASLAGGLLVACDTENCEGGSPLGTITECPLPPNPCEAGVPQAVSEGSGPACLTGDPTGTGSLRVYAARPADASAAWRVTAYFEGSGDRTNTVSGIVDQTPEQVAASGSSMDSARFARRLRKPLR